MLKHIIAIFVFGLVPALAQAGHVYTAPAASIIVTTLGDEFGSNQDECSLREAVQAANTDSAFGGCPAGQAADTITLPERNLLVLTRVGTDATNNSGDLDITSDITINGRNSTIDANGNVTNDRAVEIHSGQVTMLNIRIRNGKTSAPGGGVHIEPEGALTLESCILSNNHTPEAGGAISNYGELTLIRCTIRDNEVSVGSPAEGGGLAILVGSATIIDSTISNNTAHNRAGGISNRSGQLLMIGSTLSNNSSALVGGLDNHETGRAVLINSTVSGNTSKGSAGGIYNGFGFGQSSVTLINVTVANNIADADCDEFGTGGGVFNTPFEPDHGPAPLMTVRNSLIAQNADLSPGGGINARDCFGQVVSQGRNLFGSSAGCTGLSVGVGGDLAGTNAAQLDPKLGAPANNGGPTQTRALLAASPAIDAGAPRICRDQNQVILTADQRGFLRPTDGDGDGDVRCDIGAFEVGAVGIGVVSPNKGSSEAKEQVIFDLAWDSPKRWRDLTTLDLRFKRGKDILLWLRFTEGVPNSTISLLDKDGNVVDSGNTGEAKILKNKFGSVDLSQSGFTAAGPDDPHVAVHFAVTFKGNARGKSKIQMLATDDFANEQGPEPGGKWRVE